MRPVAKIIPPMKLGPSKRFPLCGAAVVGNEAVVVCGFTVVLLLGDAVVVVTFVVDGGDGVGEVVVVVVLDGGTVVVL